MRPRERREVGEQDLFRSRLDQIIDMKHALVKLSRAIDWRVLEQRFGSVYTDGPGSPPLPTRLMGQHSVSTTASLSRRFNRGGVRPRAWRSLEAVANSMAGA